MGNAVEDAARRPAWAGVDTHKDKNVLGLKDSLGRAVGTWEFPADPEGYDALADRIGDVAVPVGIEGARSYGAGLASRLAERGFRVYEVARPSRAQRRRGKSDGIDALAACDNLAAGRRFEAKELEGAVGEVRWLMVERDHLVGEASRIACRVDSLLVTADAGLRERWRGLSGAALMGALAAARTRGAAGGVLRRMARRWLEASRGAAELESRIAVLMWSAFPALVGAPCVGAVSAARIVLAAGSNPGRIRSEAAFSMLCGTSPVEASSGKTVRHRLNRGGDRQANRAIHDIARARMSHDPRTQDYVARRASDGKTQREAVRCLCRYIAREVYGLLTRGRPPACDPAALAGRRRAAGLTQARAAEGAGLTRSKVGRLERMDEFDCAALARYNAFLESVEKGGGAADPGLDNI